MPTVSKISDASRTRGESFRVPIDCVVDLRLDPSSDWRRTSATNISMSGMFIRTAEMRPRGSVLGVKFELQNDRPAIRTQAEVLWSRVRETGPESPQGLGVRFLNLDLESKYAISRLVDRYQQLGRMPFHLAASEDEPAPGHGSWSRRGAVALAFLAGIVAGSAGSLWLVARPGPGAEALDVARAPELAPKSVLPAGTTPGGAVEPADAAVTPAADPAMAATAAVEAWARAWATKDVERYLDSYSADFRPSSGLSFDAWRARRRARLARPGVVELHLSALEVEILAPDRAIARFDQAYATSGYQDRVRKQLELVQQDQEWKIVREEIQTELTAE